jgi:hypothetical protein
MATEKDWEFDIKRIKAKERNRFLADVRKGEEADGGDGLLQWVRRTVVQWPESCNWSTEAAWDEADIVEWEVCLRAFLRDFQRALQPNTKTGKSV